MRKFYLLFFGWLTCASLAAQCDLCTIDESCIAENDFPTVCPAVMPEATAGVYYTEYLTFNMPATVTDPGSGVTATLLEVVITNVQGLPYGIDFTMNNANNTYYPADGEQFGCATVCGTALLPGFYEIAITAHVTAEAFGFETEIDQDFISPFTVLAGEGGNNSFTYDNLAGCGVLEVNFEALINAAPQTTTYDWDFANGNTSTVQFPPTQTYTEVGEHVATLETTIWDFSLTTVLITSLASGWSGDIEELTTFQNPDPYFVITDGGGVPIYTSASLTDVQSGSWSNVNLTLNNPPYTISFWDEDLISADDFLGSWDLPSESGTFIFNAGGTLGSLNISLIAGDVFYDEQIVNVFPIPNANFDISEEIHLLSYNDSTLSTYLWFFNEDTIPDQNGPEIITSSWGIYDCYVTNIYGCSAWSESFTQCPEFNLIYDPDTDSFSAPSGFESYQWLFNGLEINGANSPFLTSMGEGNYSVEITTDYGCEVQSTVYVFTNINGIPGLRSFAIYPNPSDGIVTLELNTSESSWYTISILDQVGRSCWENEIRSSGHLTKQLDLSGLANGVYTMRLSTTGGQVTKQLVLRRS
jgi:PKD repeat protein